MERLHLCTKVLRCFSCNFTVGIKVYMSYTTIHTVYCQWKVRCLINQYSCLDCVLIMKRRTRRLKKCMGEQKTYSSVSLYFLRAVAALMCLSSEKGQGFFIFFFYDKESFKIFHALLSNFQNKLLADGLTA